MSDGWKCPNCGKTHGPHVDTCPGGGTEGIEGDGGTTVIEMLRHYRPLPTLPFPYQTMKKPLCGCELGTVCLNAACPHRTIVTCDASNATGVN